MSIGLTIAFLREFGLGIWVTSPLLFSLTAAIILIGQLVRRKEGWSETEMLYWCFITATTVGYGDFHPVGTTSRFLAILIAFMGLVLSGIIVAVAVRATSLALGR